MWLNLQESWQDMCGKKDKFELNIGIDSAQSYDMHEAYVEAHRAWTAAAENMNRLYAMRILVLNF